MKTVLKLALAIAFFAGSTVLAGDDAKAKDSKKTNTPAVEKAKKTQTAPAQDKAGVMLTGSYIKQNITRTGRITDGMSQVIVLDRETIERSGASDLKQLLSHQGVH